MRTHSTGRVGAHETHNASMEPSGRIWMSVFPGVECGAFISGVLVESRI